VHRFKSTKAGGDIKKGRVEPYAYVPLDPASLNKRTKRKAVGQWRGVVRAAQAGAKQAGRGGKKKSM
jgi:ribosomal RNA-processing protein 12